MAGTARTPARKSDDLLHTKLMPPRLHENVIAREALLARLDDGLRRRLILVTAPTGFGKTTLVGSWLAGRASVERIFAAAWVTLDPGDNDPVRFWTYLISALRTFDASLGKNALAALQTALPGPLPAVLTPLINDLKRLASPSVLILDDYHAVTSPEIHASVAFLLQHMPEALHLALISRSEPALPLAILRARDELCELDASDLRFNLAETEAFLHAALRSALPPAAAEKLQERTEGWAAGLRLAARALQDKGGSGEAEAVLASFSGTQRYVADYLIQEAFASQPPGVQDFLLKTCFLSRLTAALCDAVTQAADGAAALERLERENLFIVRLQDGGERAWYRYNSLFAESIQALARRELGEAGVRSVYERAGGWYEAEGMIEAAIDMALSAKRYERALELIERYMETHSLAGVHTLVRWLEQVPAVQTLDHPAVCFAYAQAILYTSDRFAPITMTRIEPLLQAAETAWSAAGERARLGALHSFRGLAAWWQGDLQKAFEMAHRSLDEIPEQDVMYRGSSLLTVTYEALSAGRILEAQDTALEARALLGAAQNIYGVLAAQQMLSEVFYWQGELEQAEPLNLQILSSAQEVGGDSMLDDQGIAALGLAGIAYERNDLDAAEDWAARALELARQRGNELLLAQAGMRLAAVQAARGDVEPARSRLKTLAAGVKNSAWLSLIQDAQAQLAIQMMDTAGLEGWMSTGAAGLADIPPAQQERQAFIRARYWIAAGRAERGLDALAGWQADAARQGRVRSQVEALCLEALAFAAGGDRERASQALIQALRIGQPRGLRRLFVDEGAGMAALLRTVQPRLAGRALNLYATTLLHSFSAEQMPGGAAPGSDLYVEPLSPQELRVLRLLAAGLSNAEIAGELIVSKNTIKTQVQSIYRKLNVSSRLEARQAARELNLV